MKRHDQKGGALTIVLMIVLIVGFIGVGAFGWWAFNSRQDYKNNSDKKVADAVAKAVTDQTNKDTAAFAEKEKLPNRTFKGPATYGSVTFNYPKTWSAYIDQSSAADPLKSLFYPDVVPANTQINNVAPQYALRVDLLGSSYDQVLQQFDAFIKLGTLKATAYVPPQMTQIPNVQTGTRLDGQIEQNIQGSMIVIKVRDKTLEIYTESPSFMNDFNNTILSTLTFVP